VLVACCLVSFAASADSKKDMESQVVESRQLVSDLQLRVLKLEQLVEQLTGQAEELRFKNTQLSRQVQQLQDDLSVRVAALEQAAGGRAALPTVAPAAPAAEHAPVNTQPASRYDMWPSGPQHYDPNAPASRPVAKQPEAMPETPSSTSSEANTPAAMPTTDAGGFVIRTDASGKALPPDPNAPKAPPPAAATPAAPPKVNAPPPPGAVAAGGVGAAGDVSGVTLPQGTPKQQYEYATNFMVRQDYARAEAAFRAFLKANPKDPLAANAQYWLGESLYVRGDYQLAAVEFVEGYQKYPKSSKAPDNLLKLGLTLANMRNVSGACTAFGAIAKEYPNAEDRIRKEAQTQRTKLKCPA
jgi:tol-pal system protein YbgF